MSDSGSETGQTIHASAMLVGPTAVLVRGPSGSGKSSLVLDLISTLAAEGRFAALIGDDRVIVEAANDRLVVRGAPALEGLIERRGYGIVRMAFEPAGVIGLVVDLVTGEPDRLPEVADQTVTLCGVAIRRVKIAGFGTPRRMTVLAALGGKMPDSDAFPQTPA